MSAISSIPVTNHPSSFPEFPEPWYGGYTSIESAAHRTSLGCPFRCTYCAIDKLAPKQWERKESETLIREIANLVSMGIRNIAFYDDALLADPEHHIVPLQQGLIERKVSAHFHSPLVSTRAIVPWSYPGT